MPFRNALMPRTAHNRDTEESLKPAPKWLLATFDVWERYIVTELLDGQSLPEVKFGLRWTIDIPCTSSTASPPRTRRGGRTGI